MRPPTPASSSTSGPSWAWPKPVQSCPGVGRGSGQRRTSKRISRAPTADHHSRATSTSTRPSSSSTRSGPRPDVPRAPEIVALDFKPVPEKLLPTGNSWASPRCCSACRTVRPTTSRRTWSACPESWRRSGFLPSRRRGPARSSCRGPLRLLAGTASSGSPGPGSAVSDGVLPTFTPGGLEGLLLAAGRSGRTRHDGAGVAHRLALRER